MKSTVQAILLSSLFSISAPYTAASADVFRNGPSPAESCASHLNNSSDATLRLQRLCDAGASQTDLTLSGRAAALANAGTVRIRRGDLEGAARLLAKAQSMKIAPADIVISFSAVLIRLERYDEAVQVLADLERVSEELLPQALYNRASAELQRGNVEAAYVDLRKTVALAPDYTPAQDMLKVFQVSSPTLTAEVSDLTATNHP